MLEEIIKRFLQEVEQMFLRVRYPMYMIKVEEIGMDKFRVTFAFPPLGAPDVVSRHVQLLANDVIVIDEQLPKDTFTYTVEVEEGVPNKLRLSDKDNAGNEAVDALEFEWTQVDNVPPVMVGALKIKNVEEIFPEGEGPVTAKKK